MLKESVLKGSGEMKSRSAYIVIAFLCFFHPLAQAESMAEKFVRIEEAHREKGVSEPPKSMDEYRQMQREIYGEFSVRDLFQVVRERLTRLDEPLPQGFDQIPIEALTYSLVGGVFDVMQYATTENFWADVTIEIENPKNTPAELIAMMEAFHLAEFPRNENLVQFSELFQKIYRDTDQRLDVRAVAIRTTGRLLDKEYERIFYSDPAVRAFLDSSRKVFPIGSPELAALPLTPTTEIALEKIDRCITLFINEMITLYKTTDVPKLKQTTQGAVQSLCTTPISAREAALAFLKDIEQRQTEALAEEWKCKGRKSPEFIEDVSRFTEKPKDMPDDETEIE
jgi:hypothetical protein